MNIAVVVRGGISETILATPLLGTLRAGAGDSHLTLLCPERAAVIAVGVPGIDEVVPLAALNGAVGAADAPRLWFELRRRRLDAVLLCTRDAAALLAVYLSATPQRIGFARGLGRALLTASVAVRPDENLARTWLRLAAALGIRAELHKPTFEPGPQARRVADDLLSSSPLADGRLLIAIAPGTAFAHEGDPDAWAPERYAHLANQLATRHGAGIVLLGVPSDRAVIEQTRLDLAAPAADVSGATEPATLGAVLARCDLLIGGDTPLLHLSAAVGTPTVGLFARTNGARFGPYGADHRVIQALSRSPVDTEAPAQAEPTLEQIRVEDVLASIESTF